MLYQIYPRSYMDTNGDGIGDLRGITARLDHLQWLGVDGHLARPDHHRRPTRTGATTSPTTAASNPPLGTLADAEELVARRPRADIRVHPRPRSEPHERPAPVVRRTRSRRATPKHRDWYVWADPKPDGSLPNNWVNSFDPGQPAWTFDEASGQYYLNHFLASQPDLNWWNEDVRDEFDRILRFWFDLGVAGFRIDVCH